MMNFWPGYGFWGFFPGFLWVLFWIVVLYLFWRERKYPRNDSEDKDAEDILTERFARGEIDQKEYEHRLEVIRKHQRAT